MTKLKTIPLIISMSLICNTLSAKSFFPSMIQVSGPCKKKVPTNRSRLQISVENYGKELNDLYQKTTTTYNLLYKRIKSLKLKNSEIETSSYQVKKEFNWVKGKKIFRGYKVALSISVSSSETKICR